MSSTKKGLRRVALAAVSTLVVIPAMAAIASATPTFAFDRQDGPNRYDTAVKVATTFGASTSVILANGTNKHTVDALTAAYLAGAKKAPVLLTQLAATPTKVLDRITASGATTIYIVGDTGVISAAQEAALDAKFGTVTRLGGLDRFDTAAEIIAEVGMTTSTTKTALVATGMVFPDALGAGPLSYVKGMPIGITTKTEVPAATLKALKAAGVTNAIALGGPTVVTPAMVAQLTAAGITPFVGAGVTGGRIFGDNRSETSAKLAQYIVTNQGFTNTGVNVAGGYDAGAGADALGGAPLSGKELRPTLITENVTNVGDAKGPIKFLKDNCATLASGHIFGGPAAVSPSAEATLQAAGRCVVGSNQTFTVTGGTAIAPVNTVATYSVCGITGTTADIALFAGSEVTVGTTGQVTFEGTNPGGAGNVATAVLADSTITVLNGVAGPNVNTAYNTAVSGGCVTFSVTAAATADQYVPVVFANSGDNLLSLNANGTPSELFGVGTKTTVVLAEAPAGVIAAGTVDVADQANNLFTNGTNTFYYDSNDLFQVSTDGGTTYAAATMAQFEAALSHGDGITGLVYAPDPVNQSTFQLNDTSPAAPAITALVDPTTAPNAGKAGIEVQFNDSATTTVASYNVYRATAIQPTITGQLPTCPTAAASFAKVGSVTNVTAAGSYKFYDGTATPPAVTGDNDPMYCYKVSSVDETGQEGVRSATAGPQEAAKASAVLGAPKFIDDPNNAAVQTLTSFAINTVYNQNILSGTADSGDFTAVYTNSIGTSFNLTVSTVVVSGAEVSFTGANAAVTGTGGHVVVTAKSSATDSNTVSGTTLPAQFQAVGDALFIAAT